MLISSIGLKNLVTKHSEIIEGDLSAILPKEPKRKTSKSVSKSMVSPLNAKNLRRLSARSSVQSKFLLIFYFTLFSFKIRCICPFNGFCIISFYSKDNEKRRKNKLEMICKYFWMYNTFLLNKALEWFDIKKF